MALAHAIGELEQADLTPSDLTPAGPLGADLSHLWRKANAAAGPRQTWPQVITRAAELITNQPQLATYDSALAIVTTRTSAVAARLLGALPRCELALIAARPLRLVAPQAPDHPSSSKLDTRRARQHESSFPTP